MKEGDDKLAPSAFTLPKQACTYTRDIISNAPAVKYYEQMQCFACTLLHLELQSTRRYIT